MLQVKISSSKDLEEAIAKTIAFFDLFEYPLTEWEIWQWLLGYECGFMDVRKALHSGQLKGIEGKKGFYFLQGREEIINKRLEKYNYTERKFRRAVRIAKLFQFMPWVKMVAVGNNIGAHNLSNDGDIDFFIVTEKNRIWTVRFFSVLIVKILGLRPKRLVMKDKICLSFFVSEDNSDLQGLMIDEDIYFLYWFAGLTPIYVKNGFDFFGKNKWINGYLPNLKKEKMILKRMVRGGNCVSLGFLGRLEPLLKRLQSMILPKEIKEKMNIGSDVMVNDRILKFHLNDRRSDFRDKWKRKIYELSQ